LSSKTSSDTPARPLSANHFALIRASESDSAYFVGKRRQDFFNSVNPPITTHARGCDEVVQSACETATSNLERCESACETDTSEESSISCRVGDEIRSEHAMMRVAIAIAARIRRVSRSRRFCGFGNFAVVG
jgi:hypothetical protein